MVHTIKVPRPALGMQVLVSGEVMELTALDIYKRIFDVKPFGALHPLDARLSIDTEYEPAPTRKNFERALEEWDYYYNSSDDQRKVDTGLSQAYALELMFKQLPVQDQHFYQKVKAIIIAAQSR